MFALALIKGHGGSCALIHLHAVMLKIHTYDAKKKGGGWFRRQIYGLQYVI